MANPIIRGLDVVIEAGRKFARGGEEGLPVEGSDPRLLPGGIKHASTHYEAGSDPLAGELRPAVYPIKTDTLANRPSAAAFGVGLFWTSDEHILYRSNGSAWTKIAVADYSDLSGIPSTFSPSAHGSTHTDGQSDEIISPLDPRAYPLIASTLAFRDAPTVGNAGRMWFTTDEHILYLNTVTPAWVKIGVADYADLDGIPSTFTPATHGDSAHDATVASLDGGGKVPTSELGSGTGDSGKALFGDQTWKILGDFLPWLIDIDPFMTAIAQTNWNSIWNDGSNVHGAQKESSAAQNDEICFDVVLAKGTWTVELMHNKYTDRGIYSVQFDTVEKGTIDGYNASQQYNVRSTVTGITVSATAKIRLKLKMATKNASSSNYRGSINWIQLRRTA